MATFLRGNVVPAPADPDEPSPDSELLLINADDHQCAICLCGFDNPHDHVFLPCCYTAIHHDCLDELLVNSSGRSSTSAPKETIAKYGITTCKCPVCRQTFNTAGINRDAEFVRKLDELALKSASSSKIGSAGTSAGVTQLERDTVALRYANKAFLGIFLVGFGVREFVVLCAYGVGGLVKVAGGVAFKSIVFALKTVKRVGDLVLRATVRVSGKCVEIWTEHVVPVARVCGDAAGVCWAQTRGVLRAVASAVYRGYEVGVRTPTVFVWDQCLRPVLEFLRVSVAIGGGHARRGILCLYANVASVAAVTGRAVYDWVLVPVDAAATFLFYATCETALRIGGSLKTAAAMIAEATFAAGRATGKVVFRVLTTTAATAFDYGVQPLYKFVLRPTAVFVYRCVLAPVASGTHYVATDLVPSSLRFTYELAKKLSKKLFAPAFVAVVDASGRAIVALRSVGSHALDVSSRTYGVARAISVREATRARAAVVGVFCVARDEYWRPYCVPALKYGKEQAAAAAKYGYQRGSEVYENSKSAVNEAVIAPVSAAAVRIGTQTREVTASALAAAEAERAKLVRLCREAAEGAKLRAEELMESRWNYARRDGSSRKSTGTAE